MKNEGLNQKFVRLNCVTNGVEGGRRDGSNIMFIDYVRTVKMSYLNKESLCPVNLVWIRRYGRDMCYDFK